VGGGSCGRGAYNVEPMNDVFHHYWATTPTGDTYIRRWQVCFASMGQELVCYNLRGLSLCSRLLGSPDDASNDERKDLLLLPGGFDR